MAVLSRSRQAWRSALSAVAAVLLFAAGCSSPTAPTAPPVTTPPVTPAPPPQPALSISCPANITVGSTTGAGVPVTFTMPTPSGGVVPIAVSCTRQPGSLVPIGPATVQCTATDAASASASCSFTVTVTAPIPQLSRTRFMAFGDSMTAGELATAAAAGMADGVPHFPFAVVPAVSYPTQLLSQLRARYTAQAGALQVINSGAPGEWATDGVQRLPGVMSSQRPDAVLLLEGANELRTFGTPGAQQAWRAIDLMAKEIRGRGARAFLATLPPSRATGPKAIPNAQIQALNALIAITARGEGAVLVDLYAALAADIPRYIGVDGLHPTEAGYQKIAETFFAAIRAEFETVPR